MVVESRNCKSEVFSLIAFCRQLSSVYLNSGRGGGVGYFSALSLLLLNLEYLYVVCCCINEVCGVVVFVMFWTRVRV